MSLYPDVIQQLLVSSNRYKHGEITLDSYKSEIWSAVGKIIAIEEKELRAFLQAAEAELDSIQYTTDDNKIFNSTLVVVERIEERLLCS
jgi:hypothetical protein